MTAEQLYKRIGGDYEDAKTRLMFDKFGDKMITKFVIKYPKDPSFNELMEAWEQQNPELIFRSSHTLKGVVANLSFTDLYETARAICEAYRPGQEDIRESSNVPALIEKIKVQYANTIAAIEEFSKDK